MSVNVKTSNGLKKISGENITSSKIISALGFTPAQAAAVEKYVAELRAAIDAKTEFSGDYNDLINAPAIIDDQSSALYITDSQGNIIMEVNEDGIYTTDVFLQEKSVLDAIGKVDNIVEDNSDTFLITDSQGNIIFKTDSNGVETTAITVGNTKINSDGLEIDSEKFQILDAAGKIAFQVDNTSTQAGILYAGGVNVNETLVSLEDTKAKKSDLEDHINNLTKGAIHVTEAEKALWNDKSEFDGDYNSLSNRPIIEDDTGVFKIVDSYDNIAFQVDNIATHVDNLMADDITTNTLMAGGLDVVETLNNLEQGLEDLEKITIPEVLEDYYTEEETNALLSANETQSTNYTNDAIAAIKGTVSTDYNTLEKIESKIKTKAESSVVETLSDTVDDHIRDNIRHITADERSRWEAKSDFDGDYNSLENRPVVEDESGIFVIADESGNIALQIDGEATRVDNLIVNTISTSGSANNDLIIEGTVYVDNASSEPKEVATKEYVDTELADLVNSAPETLDTLGELAKAFQENDSVVSALETAIVNKLEISDFNKHKNNENTEKHVTTDQINAWNAYETTKAKTNHAASDTTYGAGSNSLYGHVKLSDSTTGTETISSGVAATPKAVADTHALATAVNTALEAEVSRATGKENELNILLTSTNELATTTANTLSGHISNNVKHITAEERAAWEAKSDFSGDYADLENAPLVEDESGVFVIADESGNIITRIDGNGLETTIVTANSVMTNGTDIQAYVDEQISIVMDTKADAEHTHNYDNLIDVPIKKIPANTVIFEGVLELDANNQGSVKSSVFNKNNFVLGQTYTITVNGSTYQAIGSQYLGGVISISNGVVLNELDGETELYATSKQLIVYFGQDSSLSRILTTETGYDTNILNITIVNNNDIINTFDVEFLPEHEHPELQEQIDTINITLGDISTALNNILGV